MSPKTEVHWASVHFGEFCRKILGLCFCHTREVSSFILEASNAIYLSDHCSSVQLLSFTFPFWLCGPLGFHLLNLFILGNLAAIIMSIVIFHSPLLSNLNHSSISAIKMSPSLGELCYQYTPHYVSYIRYAHSTSKGLLRKWDNLDTRICSAWLNGIKIH